MAHIAKYQSGALGNMCGHYDRWGGDIEKAIEKERDNIDPKLSHLNYNLAPEREGGQVTFVRQRIESLELKRAPRKDAVRMCDCVITMPQSLDPAMRDEFFAAAYGELAAKFGDENIISAYVHLDEPKAMPHMHFAWVPVTKDGRLSAKEVVNRNVLRRLHTDLQVELERALGCPVEVLLSPEKTQEKALSNVPQKQLDAAREALKEELAEETERLEYLRQRAREIGKEVDAMAAAAAKIEQLESAPRREYGARCRDITASCNSATAKISRGIDRLRERISAVKQRITEQVKQSFGLDARKRQAREVSQEMYHQRHSYGRDVRLDR